MPSRGERRASQSCHNLTAALMGGAAEGMMDEGDGGLAETL